MTPKQPRTPDGRRVEQPGDDVGPAYIGEHPGEESPVVHPEGAEGVEYADRDQNG